MTTTEPLGDAPAEPHGPAPERWRRRPITAAVLRVVIVLAPLALAGAAGLAAGWTIGGQGFGSLVARVVVAGAVSILTFAGFERLARRLLPLTTLLKLSLVFPDRGPSRFAVALRSTSVHKLQQWARAAQHDDGVAALAEKVVTLATALNTHDRRTRGHSERSRAMAELIAVEMGLPEVNEVRWGAFLHDIGKILVPATLLNKPGAPTPHEWKTLRRHPADGGDLVEPLRLFLGSGVEAVSGHHENFDGSGYPHGLAGDDIALAARIVHVADSFEVMTAVRSYKRPMSATEARQELARHSGSQFDPDVVRALLNVSLGRLHWSLGLAAWMAEVPFLTVLPRAAAQVGAAAAAPTMSMSALSGVAAISFGSIVAPATLAPAATVAAATRSSQTVAPIYASAPVPTPVATDAAAGGPAVIGASSDPSTPAAVPESSGVSSTSESSASTPAGSSSAAPDATDVASTTSAAPASTTSKKAAASLSPTTITSTPPLVATAPTPIATSSTPPLVATAPTPIETSSPTPPLEATAPTPIETTTTTTPPSKAAKRLKASKS
jgi:hypothetical protein